MLHRHGCPLGWRRAGHVPVLRGWQLRRPAPAERSYKRPIGPQLRPKDCNAAFARLDDEGFGTRGSPDQNKHLRPAQLRPERRAQGARRNDAAIADGAPAVHNQDRQIFAQGRILKSIIHDNDGCASRNRKIGAAEHPRR